MNNQPIGVFDSGVGGLSVLRVLQQRLPHEGFIYLADSAYAPYGLLDAETLALRCRYIADFFVKQQVKAIVIACNTATAAMAAVLREQLTMPIVALEPAVKPACERTRNGRVGVFATQNTLNSQRYHDLLQTFAMGIEVFESPCLGFVEQVEKGELNSEKTQDLVRENLHPMLRQGIDTLVLGCTHYPFLKPVILTVAQEAGSTALIIPDTAVAVAKQLQNVLTTQQLTANQSTINQTKVGQGDDAIRQYYTTAQPALFSDVFSQLVGRAVCLQQASDTHSEK